jgi:hypothetical protein
MTDGFLGASYYGASAERQCWILEAKERDTVNRQQERRIALVESRLLLSSRRCRRDFFFD